jgi:hypothetical protein
VACSMTDGVGCRGEGEAEALGERLVSTETVASMLREEHDVARGEALGVNVPPSAPALNVGAPAEALVVKEA